jgi:hypothetical protein
MTVNAGPALGQTDTGRINGTVTDSTGAVVVGAKVVAASTETGVTRETETNSAGLYTFPGLKPGTYEITVSSAGFQSVVRKVDAPVGGTLDASVQLKIGNATTTVEVVGTTDANSVNVQNQTISETVTEQQLTELPTSPTRNPYALVGTAGNVTEDTQSARGAGYSINGMRSASTDILLDGAENVDTFTAGIGQQIPLDSVQEFSVLTNNFGAEFGRASGGVVNLVTKSGTNTFHGSAYEYNRVSALSSNTEQNNATDTPKGVFTRNDFGFSLGGPIKKDKLFFFNNTEWIRVRSNAPLFYSIIDPNSYSLLGASSQAYFSQYGHLLPNVKTVSSGPCTSEGTGTVAAGQPTCDQVQSSTPTDSGGGLPQNTWMEVARADWNISDKSTFYFRYAAYNELDFAGTVNASPYAGYNTGQTQFDQNYDISYSHFFTQTLANTLKLTYNRLNGPVQGLSTAPVSPTLYNSANSVPTVAGQQLIYPGYSETTPGNAIPFGGPQNLYQIHDDLAWTKGRHQFKFGGQYVQLRDNRVFGAYENAVEALGTNLNTAMTNLIAGNIHQFQGAVYPQGKYPCVKNAAGHYIVTPECTLQLPVGPPSFERNYRYNDGAVYASDSWKILPRFTLNLGIRWEYYGVQHNSNEALDSNFVMGTGSNIFEQIRNGEVKLAKDGGVFWKPRYNNFGPRVGFAYDIFGNGKTAFRAGYGISYERNFGNVTYNTIQNPPNYGVISLVSNVDLPFAMPVYTDNAGPLSGTGTKFLPAVSQRAVNQNMKTAYAETWNASIDQQVGKGVFSVAYAGSHGVHLYDIANINEAGYGSQFLGDARLVNRINYQYSNMNYRSDNGYSHYNAINVRYGVTNLGNRGLGLTANYTFGHSTDNLSSTFSDGVASNYGLGYLDAFNPRLNYGNSDYDIRHRFNLAATWDVPWLKSADNAFVRTAFGGWGLGAILNIRTGLPYSIYDCATVGATGYGCPLWAPTAGMVTRKQNAHVAGPNVYNWLQLPTYIDATNCDSGGVCGYPSIIGTSSDGSMDALAVPNCTGLFHVGCTYTPTGAAYPDRNQFQSPGYWNLDMNFYKAFRLTERFSLQFRGEFYNILNHHNMYVFTYNADVSGLQPAQGATPGTTNAATFIQSYKGGTGTATDERRNIQFGLRLIF